MGQAPNAGSTVTRINVGDDTPAVGDAIETGELLESEGLRREAVESIIGHRSRSPAVHGRILPRAPAQIGLNARTSIEGGYSATPRRYPEKLVICETRGTCCRRI